MIDLMIERLNLVASFNAISKVKIKYRSFYLNHNFFHQKLHPFNPFPKITKHYEILSI